MNEIPSTTHAAHCGVAYRNMTDQDMAFLTRLYRSTREEEMATTPWSDGEKQSFIEMQFRAQHTHYQQHYPDALWLVIEVKDKPIGRLYLERWTSEIRIIDIALLPSARGQGIGSAILRDLLDEAAQTGRNVGIHVEKVNPAMSLYRRLGFQMIEDKGVYDLMIWSPSA